LAKKPPPIVFAVHDDEANAVLSFNEDGLEDFVPYAQGYRNAAETVWRDIGPRYAAGQFAEFELLPVLFLLRHSIELSLKWSALRSRGVERLHGGNPPYDNQLLSSHGLLELTDHLIRSLDAAPGAQQLPSRKHLHELRPMIVELDRIDQRSMVFRYPVTKEGGLSLREHFQFDMAQAVNHLFETAGHLIELGLEVGEWWDDVSEDYVDRNGHPGVPISPRLRP
jgi:hypothetical protein